MALLTFERASSSSSTSQWNYDVFLNFRAEDTRYGFISHLYKALCDNGFNTFIDDNVQRGEEISTELLRTIELSMISIVVLSEDYASSTWCLDELVKILEYRTNGQLVLPVFYKVDPSEIRKQERKFGAALAKHEEKFKDEIGKVQRWKEALNEVGSLSGWHYENREVVRRESPQILGERSRLWRHKDSYEVLTGNKGSDKIRGILFHPPEPVKVQLHTEVFKRMENLKFLIVENVDICEALNYLPNGLRFLKWPEYRYSLPSKYCPQQLVALEMSHSQIRLEKLFKQGFQFKNLKDVNLKHCEFITKLPDICTPNLETLELFSCKNLVEIHESFGFHEKLKKWSLDCCKKLKILPRNLMLKSLEQFNLRECPRLEMFPNIHPEMKDLKVLNLTGSSIRELPSSIGYLTGLERLDVYGCQNLRDLPDSIYKLQQLMELEITTTKLRTVYDSFDSFSGNGFLKMKILHLNPNVNLNRLDILMKPDYFPALESLYLSGTNIITIPESFSRFPRLKTLSILNCKQLREILGLPQSIRSVDATNCMSLDPQSSLSQIIETMGILPNRVYEGSRSDLLMDPQSSTRLSHKVLLSDYEGSGIEAEDDDCEIMEILPNRACEGLTSEDPQSSNDFASEIAGSETEDCVFIIPRAVIPKWFNHHSVGNSISFWVGRRFPNLFAICIALGPEEEAQKIEYSCSVRVDASINGCETLHFGDIGFKEHPNHLWLYSLSHQRMQEHLNYSNPSEHNHVEVQYEIYGNKPRSFYELLNHIVIKRWGVYAECICGPQKSGIPNLHLPSASHDEDYDDDDDDLSVLPLPNTRTNLGTDDLVAREYQPPLVFDDTSNWCMTWLVGPTAKFLKAFCCLEIFPERVTEALRA
ncbi:TMV resistance protein N-like isoform X3 [Quercus robur]|uniref:TMV resistance protein N-like isoform X3 n=1 Tax=Quercus robur TaxID=38942 RepID=UPI0021638170|nr:TMV resistance protein N-like isoform X3 [Quercus robur]